MQRCEKSLNDNFTPVLLVLSMNSMGKWCLFRRHCDLINQAVSFAKTEAKVSNQNEVPLDLNLSNTSIFSPTLLCSGGIFVLVLLRGVNSQPTLWQMA